MEDCTATQSLNSTQAELHMASTADINNPSFAMGAVGVQNSAVGGNSEPIGSEVGLKRRRGRPRKYDANLSSPKSTPSGLSTSPSSKRGRGRPRGSGKLQILASMGGMFSATAGGSFVPHVVIVNPGEDVLDRILSFSRRGPRALCILSAIGAVAVVHIRQPDSSGHCLRYQGLFEIITLSGSYTYGGIGGGTHRKSLTMSISLAQPDGKLFGGSVGGSLIAAGRIQLILGNFKQNISSEIKRRLSPGSSGTADMPGDSDSRRLSLQVPKLIESEQSFPSPTSGLMPTSNGLPDHVAPRTSNGFPDNVSPATTNGNGLPDFFSPNQSMHPTSLNGSGLDCQILQPLTDQITFGDN